MNGAERTFVRRGTRRAAAAVCLQSPRDPHRPTRSGVTGQMLEPDDEVIGIHEIRELRQPCEENVKMKHLVVDLALDKHILAGIARKKI